MTNQEIFDRVLAHLRTQGSRAMMYPGENSRVCAYRGHDGKMCAVGCLIEDSEYDENIETAPISKVIKMRKFKNFDESNLELLSAMQTVHDDYRKTDGDFVDFVDAQFKNLAKRFELVYNE